MTPKPNLHLIEGEIRNDCPRCSDLKGKLDIATEEFLKARRQIKRLKADTEDRHRSHKLREQVESLFDLWRETCGHPNSKLDYGPGSRFERILWGLTTYGVETCERAIRGAAFQPYKTQRKNGTTKRHDDLSLIFKNADKVEDFTNRAPGKHA